MNDNEMRIEIAKAVGWRDCLINNIPDYPNDLNAMHAAFLSLNEGEKTVFTETLCAITSGNVVDWGYYPGEGQIEWHSIATMVNATASQRAEAFLRTKGLWK